MERTKIILVVLSSLTFLFACKKEKKGNQVQGAEEMPLKTIVNRKAPADSIYQMNFSAANYGLKFHSNVNGKITKLGCRMPAPGTYTVSLWDFASHNQLAQVQVTVTNTNDFNYASITPVNISDINSYAVSVNSNSGGVSKPYYQLFKKPHPVASIYPITAGNIIIDEPLFKMGTTAFPDGNNVSDFPYLRGVADFVFVEGAL